MDARDQEQDHEKTGLGEDGLSRRAGAFEEVFDDDEDSLPEKYSITSYGVDFTVDGLVRRMERGDIVVPKFQRRYVWDHKKASRLIESLLLGLPVPGIFLSKESDTQKLLVIDGQQRLMTLAYFCNGCFDDGKVFVLRGISKQLESLSYEDLQDEDRRQLDDAVIHATVVKQESPADGDSSIYYIFERLNTGGVELTDQEIRASIYRGGFNDFINSINKDGAWRILYGKSAPDERMRDAELILRFFALYDSFENYQKTMKEFLNKYMAKNRHIHPEWVGQLRARFIGMADFVLEHLGQHAFKPRSRQLHSSVFDAVAIGIAKRLETEVIKNTSIIRDRFDALLEDDEFVRSSRTGTSASRTLNPRHRRISLDISASWRRVLSRTPLRTYTSTIPLNAQAPK